MRGNVFFWRLNYVQTRFKRHKTPSLKHAAFNSEVYYQWYFLQIHCYANKLIPAVLIITLVNSSFFLIRYSVCHANNTVQLNLSRKPGYN